MIRITLALIALVGIIIFFGGCTSEPAQGAVEGVVLINGQPGTKVRVEFHPDERKGTQGSSSFAETDAEGHFNLVGPVAVGWHKVVVQDMKLAQSETGRGVQVRFGPEYAKVLTTPLDAEVKPGAQSITIEVPKK